MVFEEEIKEAVVQWPTVAARRYGAEEFAAQPYRRVRLQRQDFTSATRVHLLFVEEDKLHFNATSRSDTILRVNNLKLFDLIYFINDFLWVTSFS